MIASIFRNIPHLIMVKDEKGRFVFVNEAVAKLYGAASTNDMLGKTDAYYNPNKQQVTDFLLDDEWVRKHLKVRQIPKEGNTDSKGKVHFLNTIKAPLVQDDGKVYVMVAATFIDQVVALEKKLAAEQMRESRKADMALLASTLAHKINTRISILETIALTLNAPGDIYDELLAEMEHLKRFTDDFLKLAFSSRIRVRETNLIEILHRALRLPRGKTAEVTIGGHAWPFRHLRSNGFDLQADEGKITDVFAELLSNSLKAADKTPHQVRLTITPYSSHLLAKGQRNQEARRFRILFEDNGPGISDKVRREGLFDSFVSGDSDGTGIGLAMVREVIHAHGGRIQENSKPGQGARFEIILPTKPPKQSS